jgi:hypothetical protein
VNSKILSRLRTIETQENIRIVHACESGSRAWGFPSADSDDDVRFLYVRPVEWYLSIDVKRDVIERPVQKTGRKVVTGENFFPSGVKKSLPNQNKD